MDDNIKVTDHVFWIETSKIRPNPMQPRRSFNEAALNSLAISIREYGILQPLIVTRVEKEVPTGTTVEYELIAGERRLRAAQLLKLPEVPVIIRRQESAKVKLELSIVENVQREDLNPVERALAYRRLVEEFGLSHRDVATRIGKSREVITNTLRLLNLPELCRESLMDGRITEGHARPLLMLVDYPEEQERLFHKILDEKISVREAERLSRDIAIERSRKYKKDKDPETQAVEEQLGNLLGARVSIVQGKKGKGKISIEFFSSEELFGIAQKITGLEDGAQAHSEKQTSQDAEEEIAVEDGHNGSAQNAAQEVSQNSNSTLGDTAASAVSKTEKEMEIKTGADTVAKVAASAVSEIEHEKNSNQSVNDGLERFAV